VKAQNTSAKIICILTFERT